MSIRHWRKNNAYVSIRQCICQCPYDIGEKNNAYVNVHTTLENIVFYLALYTKDEM